MKALLHFSILATWPAYHNLLDLIALAISGERYKLWSSSLWSLLYSSFAFLLALKILVGILFSNTLSLHSSLNVRDHASQSYSTTGNIIVLYFLVTSTHIKKSQHMRKLDVSVTQKLLSTGERIWQQAVKRALFACAFLWFIKFSITPEISSIIYWGILINIIYFINLPRDLINCSLVRIMPIYSYFLESIRHFQSSAEMYIISIFKYTLSLCFRMFWLKDVQLIWAINLFSLFQFVRLLIGDQENKTRIIYYLFFSEWTEISNNLSTFTFMNLSSN